MHRFLPTFTELSIASAVAGIWCALMADSFYANTTATSTALFAGYIAIYWVSGLVVAVGLRPLTRRVLRGKRLPRWAAIAALGIAPLVVVWFVASRALVSAPSSAPAASSSGGHDTAPTRWSVQLIGLDGTDMDVLRALVGRGALPNFGRLLSGGVSARLSTVSPHSPVVWTSMATGAPPSQHGVLDYTSEYLRGTGITMPLHPLDGLGYAAQLVGLRQSGAVSGNERRAKAIWEILGDAGKRSLVIGWWATYPAEPIDGVMISNRAIPWGGFGESDIDELDDIPRLTSPASSLAEVQRITRQVVHRWGAGKLRRDNGQYFDVRDEISYGLYRTMRDGSKFALSTVYLQSIDTRSHVYTSNVFGGNLPDPRPMLMAREQAQALWEKLVVGGYRRADAVLGNVMSSMRPEDCLIVVSDHGWKYDGSGHWSMPPGVLIAYGPAFRAGLELSEAGVYDVLPTIAYLLGVPVSRDLPGRVLTEALAGQGWPPVTWIDTYGPRHGRVATGPRGSDDEHLEQLRSLGYVQ